MIVDHIGNAARYAAFGPLFERAFAFLREEDIETLPTRRHEILGDRLFALVQQYPTKPLDQGFWEAHRRYIDLQFIVRGRERIGYAPLSRMTLESHDEARDLSLLAGEGELLTLHGGSFMLLWPDDAHMPGLQVGAGAEEVRKVVFKIAA